MEGTTEAPNVSEFLNQQEAEREKARQEKYKKSERRDMLMVFAAATLAGTDVSSSSYPIEAHATIAVNAAEAVLRELEKRGYLD
jgi:hypothetical protein